MASRNRAHLFTWNNYPATYSTHLDGLPTRYCVAGRELAPTTGVPHLQGYCVWTSGKTLSAVRALLPGCHITVAAGNHGQNDRYCRKTREQDSEPNRDVYCRGDLPSDPADRGAAEKARWENAWDLAKNGDIENIPADIRVRQYSTLLKIQRDYMPRWSDSEDLAVLGFGALLEAAKPDPCLTRYPTSTPSPATNGGMAINERKLSSSTILTDLTSSSEDTSNTGPMRTRLSPKLRVARRKFALSDSSSPPNTPLKKMEDSATREALLRRL